MRQYEYVFEQFYKKFYKKGKKLGNMDILKSFCVNCTRMKAEIWAIYTYFFVFFEKIANTIDKK